MGRYITTTGTAAPVLREVSTTYTAQVNDRILCDSASGVFTITFPAAASLLVGDQIQVIDATSNFNGNNVTIDRNGALINGASENLILDIDGSVVTLLYTGTTYGWVITSS